MGGQLLVTQALDERELLIHKIMDKINAASFVDMAKHNEERTAAPFQGRICEAGAKGFPADYGFGGAVSED